MAKYMIQSKHTKGECVQAVNEILKKNPKLLEETHFGCMGGDHTGWVIVEANNESEARNKIPSSLRSKVHVVKVVKFTPGQIKFIHEV